MLSWVTGWYCMMFFLLALKWSQWRPSLTDTWCLRASDTTLCHFISCFVSLWRTTDSVTRHDSKSGTWIRPKPQPAARQYLFLAEKENVMHDGEKVKFVRLWLNNMIRVITWNNADVDLCTRITCNLSVTSWCLDGQLLRSGSWQRR